MTTTCTRRLALGALAGMAVLGLAPARAAGMALTSQRTTAKSWLYAPEDYALACGYFARFGLDLAISASGRGVNTDALLGGTADVILSSPVQNFRVQIQHQPVVNLFAVVNKFASNVVVSGAAAAQAGVSEASPLEAKGAALRGLRLGHPGAGSGPERLLRYALRAGGLNPDRDAVLVPITSGGPAMLAAMQAGHIDGFCLSSPTSDVAVRKLGAVYLLNMATNPPPAFADFVYITAACTTATLASKRAALVAYAQGMTLALRDIRDRPADYTAWARGFFTGMEPEIFESAARDNLGIYVADPRPTAAQFRTNKAFLDDELRDTGRPPSPESFGFADAYDLSVIDAALAAL